MIEVIPSMVNRYIFLPRRWQKITVLLLLLCLLPFSACQTPDKECSLLKDAVIYENGKFALPGVDWYCSQETLQNQMHLEDMEPVEGDLSCLRLKEKKQYTDPQVEAMVQYLFVSNSDKRLVGVDYLLEFEGRASGAALYESIALQAEEYFGEPNGTQPPVGSAYGVSWEGTDSSLFSIRHYKSKDEYLVTISIRAPKSEEQD